MRMLNVASSPWTTGITVDPRTSARLDFDSTIFRDVNGTGWK
jgi:hypothetical protein